MRLGWDENPYTAQDPDKTRAEAHCLQPLGAAWRLSRRQQMAVGLARAGETCEAGGGGGGWEPVSSDGQSFLLISGQKTEKGVRRCRARLCFPVIFSYYA